LRLARKSARTCAALIVRKKAFGSGSEERASPPAPGRLGARSLPLQRKGAIRRLCEGGMQRVILF
jgi:hypothetical protein